MDDRPAVGERAPEDPDVLVLHAPEQFKALGHPVRHRIVNLLRQRPATLGELAEALGAAKGTVAYHLRVLRGAGIVHLAGTRHVRGGTEQTLALVNRGFRVHEEAPAGAAFLVRAALDEMRPARPGQAEHTVLNHIWLTPEEAGALADRLRDLVPVFGPAGRPDSEPYGLLLALYPADIPTLPPGDDTAP
ncbi:winged helix-turn-helix domain-containing protein [Microtetraspora sp. AC03309]|uniref:winged helix-turn-helix domain-containing protein n=1 Tax=Microtetraspora sp. AC03309 TaxID=2779376 RepID=UPI001E3A88C6|nr:winged helix-turn-helix domain-containing protein [Microtetraspora sp. AC03309]